MTAGVVFAFVREFGYPYDGIRVIDDWNTIITKGPLQAVFGEAIDVKKVDGIKTCTFPAFSPSSDSLRKG